MCCRKNDALSSLTTDGTSSLSAASARVTRLCGANTVRCPCTDSWASGSAEGPHRRLAAVASAGARGRGAPLRARPTQRGAAGQPRLRSVVRPAAVGAQPPWAATSGLPQAATSGLPQAATSGLPRAGARARSPASGPSARGGGGRAGARARGPGPRRDLRGGSPAGSWEPAQARSRGRSSRTPVRLPWWPAPARGRCAGVLVLRRRRSRVSCRRPLADVRGPGG